MAIQQKFVRLEPYSAALGECYELMTGRNFGAVDRIAFRFFLFHLIGNHLHRLELPEIFHLHETASRFDPRFGGEQKFAIFRAKPLLEVEKRDLTFSVVKPGCFAFILDGDEICVGDVKAGLDFVRSKAEDESRFSGCTSKRILEIPAGSLE